MPEKMIVACPECQTRFVAPLEKFLPAGRKVRCAKCAHAWFQTIDGPRADAAVAPNKSALEEAVSTQPIGTVQPKATIQPLKTTGSVEIGHPKETAKEPQDFSNISVIERAEQRRAELQAQEVETATDLSASAAVAGASAAAVTAATQIENVKTRAADVSAAEIAATTREASVVSGAADVVAPMPEVTPVTHPTIKKRSFFPRALFYALAAAIVAGALGYFLKDEISAKVPALEPKLASWEQTVDGVVSGVVPPNGSLSIEDIAYTVDEVDGEPQLRVSADVMNNGSAVKPAPELEVKVYGADDTVLNETMLSPENLATEIAAEASETYFWKLPYPPENIDRVEVDFAK